MKRFALISMVLAVMVCLTAGVVQASPKKRFDPGTQSCRILGFDSGWWGTGSKIFKANCKSCHSRGNDQGAPFLHSESKTPKAWNRVFFEKYPECARDGSWNLTLNEQLKLNDFLYRNGANTYDPYDADDCG